MTNRQLPDFLTAENDLDGQEPVYIAQGGKTRKTLLSKIKEFIIGTTELTTTDKSISGAIEEVKEIADNNTTQLNEITNKITFKNENITPLNNWVNTIDSNPPVIGKILNSVTLLADLKGGITTNDTVILQLPSWAYPFRTRSFSIVSCDSDWIYKVGMITITTDGKVLLSGFIANTKLTISVTYQV